MIDAPDIRCGTCRWYKFSLGPTGRKRPNERGQCVWPLPWPEKWPEALLDSRWYPPRPPGRASPRACAGTRCACWERNTK